MFLISVFHADVASKLDKGKKVVKALYETVCLPLRVREEYKKGTLLIYEGYALYMDVVDAMSHIMVAMRSS